MSTRRPPLFALLAGGVLCVFLGAGSVFAAAASTAHPVAVSALTDYDNDTLALKRADLARALAANGASPDRVVLSYTHGSPDQTTLDRAHELVGGTLLLGDHALGR